MSIVERVAAFVYGIGVLFGATASGLVIGTLGVLPFAVVPRGRRERLAMPAAALWARTVLGLLAVRFHVRGRVDLRPGEGALIVCNHRSWVDPVALMAATRSNGLSKNEIFWLPVIGLYGWLAGAVFFDRRDPRGRERARREVMDLAMSGHRIQVFPEGTRSRDGRLKEQVYLRLLMDCYSRGVAIVPCAIVGSEDALPAHRLGAWPFKDVTLEIGAVRRPQEFTSAAAYARACWEDVRGLVTSLHDASLADR